MKKEESKKNEEEKPKIKAFTDLEAWKQARILAKQTYNVTMTFPKEEMFGMSIQMKKAAVSIPSNVAEGFKRDTMKDKIRFYVQAHGSLTELQNQIIISKDVGLIDEEIEVGLWNLTVRVDKLLNGLIRASKEKLL